MAQLKYYDSGSSTWKLLPLSIPQEVSVGATQPGAGYDLWVDTSSSADPTAAVYSMAAGFIDIVSPGSEVSHAGSVVFPTGRFNVQPVVTATLVIATTNMLTNVSAVTSTGFTITVFHKTAGQNITAATYTCHWMAIQMTSTTGYG